MSMGRCSSVSSISLLDIKAESRLVLQAFLNQTLSIPFVERPGRVGGGYKEYNKYSASVKPNPKVKDGWDSQAEDQSSADEKKPGFKDFLKQLPRRSYARSSNKDGKGSLEKDNKPRAPNIRELSEEDILSPSSTSEEDDGDKKQKGLNKKKLKKKISKFFKIKEKEKEKENDQEKEKKREEKEGPSSQPKRPSTLLIDKTAEPISPLVSPNHPPEFYNEVAQKLEKIAQRSTSTKKVTPLTPPQDPSVVDNKELVVQQLVQVLSVEAESINNKIQMDPFLRSSLARLSYPSFARLLDTVSSTQVLDVPLLQPTASPTLRRMAVSMEVSRRIVTATGVHRMQGYAECYMENFAPWLKSRGGWENVAEMKDPAEYD
ncbi:apoptosis facilitator Bcl-2-like protein 14 isoform X2 [Corythoichthys intestinalis]|uniref:apoptosis facilitator Bcl-2-like protein 14 isoform X2 n=1 Tax=Corythoichthys intestinalis TaxID=161448 RepID=UPI0025A5C213|nr:apoptosis facilitator Bcl-2-like protein 14 isoform X2 [Corythoichthys intestinalis]